MLCGLGAVSLGYRRQDQWPGVCSLPHRKEVEAAEAALKHVAPWGRWVRFLKTGSEATLAAMMIAKAATKRDVVMVGDWAYHGGHEWCANPDPLHRYPHGTRDFYFGDVAAVFVEPHRWEPVDVEWLRWLREACDKAGSLLVFDSMIYGGRWHLEGTSGYFGVQADLECFGKAYGNGQSVAFVVGTERTYAHGEIPSGTYSGDVVGLSAVIDTLQEYTTKPIIETLWARGRQLADGLDAQVRRRPDLLKSRDGAPVHQRLTFRDADDGLYFAQNMWERGILWHPGATNVMAAHTTEQIDTVIAAAHDSLEAMS